MGAAGADTLEVLLGLEIGARFMLAGSKIINKVKKGSLLEIENLASTYLST